MLYTTWKIGEEEYKLRLTSKNAVALEERLGKHPLSCVMFIEDDLLPSTKEIVLILHASLQAFNHKIAVDDVYDLYDTYIGEGNSIAEIVQLLIEIFRTAGFIFEEEEKEEGEEKNV